VKGHVYEMGEVVIGGTMSAAMHSYVNNLPLFFAKHRPPFRFELYEDGTPKAEAFRRLMFVLSLKGLNMASDNISSMRFSDDVLKLTTKNSALIRVAFSRATIFDEAELHNIDPPAHETKAKFKVYDWFSVRKGMVHEHDKIDTDSDFVQRVHFYPSDRIDGKHDKKDLVAVSTMTEEQLHDIDYSDIYVKFKVADLMKSAGIHGPRNGVCASTGRQKYHSIVIEHDRRDSSRLARPKRQDTEFLTYNYTNYQDDEELWSQISKSLPHFT
tara:strand:- start:1248 stop:2057 length:810 start_codon:yes stop_codon:yes gene_type:complete